MKNKARVHMLPTEGSGILLKGVYPEGSEPLEILPTSDKEWLRFGKPQHLYITTDEEIKEGDWFTHTSHGKSELLRCISSNEKELFGEDDEKWVCWRDYSRKIIATTDPKLTIRTTRLEKITNPGVYEKPLPQISQSFIEEYCKAGGIDEVLVEYELKMEVTSYSKNGSGNLEPVNTGKPKLDSNNCIIIHPAKLTGEDVIAKMGWDWYETESSARRVAEFCANNLIHPVEEKMYTLKQMKHMFDIGRDSAFQEMHFDEAIKYRDNELSKMD